MDFEDDVFEDAFEDERYCDRELQNENQMQLEQFELEQPLISLKMERNAFTVNREVVNSVWYHNRFEELQTLGINKHVREGLYKEAGRLLEFVDGHEYERMVAVDIRTGDLVTDNFARVESGSIAGTGFNAREYQMVQDCENGIAIIHNHSLNGRPSMQDIFTFLHEDKVKLSIVVCHDGSIYTIYDADPEIENRYNKFLNDVKYSVSDPRIAEQLATSHIYQLNETFPERKKLVKFRYSRKEY